MKKKRERGQWSSNFGFIVAAAGSAVGLGNIWKFPYVAGNNGGGVFVCIYIAIVLLIGFSLILAEMALGRSSKLNAVGAFASINKKFKFVGVLGVITSFIILSYYGVLGGWVLEYIAKYLTGGHLGAGDAAQASQTFFDTFISSPYRPVLWHILFMVATILIVVRGIEEGIEKSSKIFMPALFILFLIVMIRSITLPGASAGLEFFLKPDWSKINAGVIVSALGQVFFSLSLGMGINITYGSYLNPSTNLERNSIWVPSIDTMVALIAGLTILPAVFAFGLQPTQGPGLLFVTLPTVFQSMPFGALFGFLFFALVFFAAITSSVALLEVSVSYLIDAFQFSRKKAVIIAGTAVTLVGIPSALSFGPWSHITIFGKSIFDFMDFITTNILLPIGGIFLCIVVSYIWGLDKAKDEITNHGTVKFYSCMVWGVIMKFLAPIALIIIFLNSIGILKF